MLKKMLCVMLSVILLIPATIVYGEDKDIFMNPDIELWYTNTTSVKSTLAISGSTATCKVVNVMSKNHTSSITMTLQKSTNKSSYSKVTSWSGSFSGIGSKSLTKTYAVSKGYYYRVKAIIKVTSGSTVIETITKYSTVVYH